MPRWVMPISAVVMTTVAAIALAAQLHPDAPSQVMLHALELPAILTRAAVDRGAFDDEFWREEKIARGDTVVGVLARLGVRDDATPRARDRRVQPATWRQHLHSDPDARALYRLLPGKTIRVRTDEDNALLGLRYLTRDGELLEIDRDDRGNYRSRTVAAPTVTRVELRSGEIQSSLFGAADAAGMPDAVTVQMAEIFSGDIDFFHDLRKGDRFTAAYEVLEHDGQAIKVGRVLGAEFVNRGVVYRAFHYAIPGEPNEPGMLSYFTEDGKNLRRAFLRSPMEFSRVTSHFTLARFHPILQTWRAHRGTDFGAPHGTPVRATGDGTVDFAGRQGGYGNLVVLKHHGAYSTSYGHLSRFAPGVRKGTRIRQGEVIGFVGATGWATGPHLHYEFRVANEHRNPMSIPLPTALPVPAERLAAFRAHSRSLSMQLALARGMTFASVD